MEINTKTDMVGCDGLRAWLIDQGYRCYVDALKRGNMCNWYAAKRSDYPARECECNYGKKMQIVICPFACRSAGQVWESVEVDATGEVQGLWFKLSAFSVTPDELKARLQEIEIMLIDSWNALTPNVGAVRQSPHAAKPQPDGDCP